MRRALAALCLLAAAGAAGAEPARLAGHGGPIKGVAVAPDGRTALTASFDYAVGLWDIAAHPPRRLAWLDGHRAAVNAVAFLPDGGILSAGDDFAMLLWDRETAGETGEPLHRFEGHEGKILAIAVGPEGRIAATAGWDGRIGLWDVAARRPLGFLEGHASNVNDLAFSADGATLYSASYDGTVRAWDVAARAERATLVAHGFGVNHLALHEAAGWLAYGAVDGAVRVLRLADGARLADLTADRRPILALALSADRTRLAVGDGEGHIMVIGTEDWEILRDFRAAARGPIWALAWAGDRLLAGGIADEAAFWQVGAETPALFAGAPRHFQRPPSEMSNGERQFVRKCAVCHTLTPDGGRRAGPSLHGVFGREAGTLAGYRFSEALLRSEIVWTEETVDRLFDEGPDHVTPGSKMPMQRIARPEDRADLIAFLKRETAPDTDHSRRQPE